MGRGDAGDLEDGETFAGGGELRRIALLGLEGLGDDLRAVGQRGDHALRCDQRRGDDLQMMRRGGLLQAVLDGLGGERLRVVLFGLGGLLADQRGLDGGQDFVERLGVRGLPLLHLDDVIAELGLHDLGVADLLGEDGVVELRHHGAALGKAQFAALVFAAGIVGVLLGQIGKVRAALNLLEDGFGFGLGGGIGLGVGAGGHLDEDVARPGRAR